MAKIYRFPDGKMIQEDQEDEGLRILREKKYLSQTARIINKVQENIEWLVHPVIVNDRLPGEETERKKFSKKNREHSRFLRKIRTILYKKTKRTPGEKNITPTEPGVVDSFLDKTGM